MPRRLPFNQPADRVSVHSHENLNRERVAYFFGLFIFGSSLLLVVLTAVPYGSSQFWWTSFFEFAVFAITALWSMEALIGNGYRWRRWGWVVFAPTALILFCLIQIYPFGRTAGNWVVESSLGYTISSDAFETRSFALRITALTLFACLLLRFTTSRARLRVLIITVISIATASAVFGILRQTMQHAELGFLLPALPRGIGYAQIISRNQFAFMMEMALGLTLGMILSRARNHQGVLFYLALGMPLIVALILANSRGGIITMICQLLFSALFVGPAAATGAERKIRHHAAVKVILRVALIIAVLGLTTTAIVWIGGERVVSNLGSVSEELKAEDQPARWNTRRVDIWRATWSMIKDHPVTGVGFGGYWTAISQYHDASGKYTPQQAHNDYLETLASGGLVGAGIFVWLIVVVLKRLKRRLSNGDAFTRAAAIGALIGLVGVVVHSMFDFGLHLTINSVLCVALVAIGTADVGGD